MCSSLDQCRGRFGTDPAEIFITDSGRMYMGLDFVNVHVHLEVKVVEGYRLCGQERNQGDGGELKSHQYHWKFSFVPLNSIKIIRWLLFIQYVVGLFLFLKI